MSNKTKQLVFMVAVFATLLGVVTAGVYSANKAEKSIHSIEQTIEQQFDVEEDEE